MKNSFELTYLLVNNSMYCLCVFLWGTYTSVKLQTPYYYIVGMLCMHIFSYVLVLGCSFCCCVLAFYACVCLFVCLLAWAYTYLNLRSRSIKNYEALTWILTVERTIKYRSMACKIPKIIWELYTWAKFQNIIKCTYCYWCLLHLFTIKCLHIHSKYVYFQRPKYATSSGTRLSMLVQWEITFFSIPGFSRSRALNIFYDIWNNSLQNSILLIYFPFYYLFHVN